jgi:hypothetical protein
VSFVDSLGLLFVLVAIGSIVTALLGIVCAVLGLSAQNEALILLGLVGVSTAFALCIACSIITRSGVRD